MAQLFASITQIEGIGAKKSKVYKSIGISSIRDLILYMPNKVLIRKINPKFSDIKQSDQISKEVVVVKLDLALNRGSSKPSKIICDSGGEAIHLTYFHAPIPVLSQKFVVGSRLIVSGEANLHYNYVEIIHPTQVVGANEGFKIAQYEPIYPATRGLNSKFINLTIKKVLTRLSVVDEWLPNHVISDYKWPSFNRALNIIHNPKSIDDTQSLLVLAKQRLAFDEVFCQQIKLNQLRNEVKKSPKTSLQFIGSLKNAMINSLSYTLTNAQLRVIAEIERDLQNDRQTSRLIQGDVGAGKTIVALSLMLDAVEAGAQVALMVPTEILALQHYKSISRLVERLDIKCTLLIGGIPAAQKRLIQEKIATGNTNIIIGTHALFQEKVNYKNLRLVIIDEQHRFGVEQRQQLQSKGNEVDLIMMTATPIPRSLEMINYGDMDVSIIDEKPMNRKEIITSTISYQKAAELVSSMEPRLADGEKVYWVCPLIEETEKLDLAHAEQRHRILADRFPGQVGLIHGRMKKPERENEMQKFVDGDYKILVATTVIEVGVDVKDATIMVIENAERFGLSQLHQLRGRVGRGSKQSYCILIYGKMLSKIGQQRLKIMKDSSDGFYIADEDLKLRGAGDIVGTRQSGMLEFRIFDPIDSTHNKLLNTAFNLARSKQNHSDLHLRIFGS